MSTTALRLAGFSSPDEVTRAIIRIQGAAANQRRRKTSGRTLALDNAKRLTAEANRRAAKKEARNAEA